MTSQSEAHSLSVINYVVSTLTPVQNQDIYEVLKHTVGKPAVLSSAHTLVTATVHNANQTKHDT